MAESSVVKAFTPVLRMSVNINTEIANEPIIINGLYFDLLFNDPPKTTGKRGSVQGVSTVRIPARNDVISKMIMLAF